jgi:peptidoglycan/LPS O-acetylase OafA/YrhL
MTVALGIAFGLVAVGVAAGTALLYRGDHWPSHDPDARRRGAIAGMTASVALIAAAALTIAEPWGHRSLVLAILATALVVVLAQQRSERRDSASRQEP